MSERTAPTPLWGTAEVARYCNVSESTVRAWRFNDVGPQGHRVGKHVRYNPNDVIAWVESDGDQSAAS